MFPLPNEYQFVPVHNIHILEICEYIRHTFIVHILHFILLVFNTEPSFVLIWIVAMLRNDYKVVCTIVLLLLAAQQPLKVKFAKDSLIVSGNNMTAFIHISKPVSRMKCRMSGTKEMKNCEWSLDRSYRKTITYFWRHSRHEWICAVYWLAMQSDPYTHSKLLLKQIKERQRLLNDSWE